MKIKWLDMWKHTLFLECILLVTLTALNIGEMTVSVVVLSYAYIIFYVTNLFTDYMLKTRRVR